MRLDAIMLPLVLSILVALVETAAAASGGRPAAAEQCRTSDLRGKWDVYAFNNAVFSQWTACETKFTSTGQIVRRKTLCVNNLSTASTLTGRLSVDRGCRVTGQLTQQIISDETDIRVLLTLSPGRETFFGVGVGRDGSAFIVQGTKR